MSEATDGPIERPLAHYRVLEMPGIAPLLAGKMLADLGADVVHVEPAGGDPVRRMPPLVESEAAPDGRAPGLVWAAYSIGKRFVTADLATEAGRKVVRRLASEADVLIEGYRPGEMAAMGLAPSDLRVVNPRLVVTSLSSFGQDGPYAQRRGSDLVHFAMSCYLHMTGPGDGPPIKPSAPLQTYLHAAHQSVAATLLALRQREQTGAGTHVDQAIRDVGTWMLTHTYQFWDMLGVNLRRLGSARDMGGVRRLRSIFECRDGHVVWLAITGHIGGAAMHALVEWMDECGLAPEWLRDIDWREFDYLKQQGDIIDRLEEVFAAFFATRSKAELLEWALANRLMLAPLQDLRDVLEDPQLAFRQTWRKARIDGVATPVRIPGPPVRMSRAVWEPRIGVPSTVASGEDVSWLPRPEPSPLILRYSKDEATLHRPTRGLPLDGVRVLDFSTTIAGPAAARHLADFGAEVIKIESRAHPDTIRFASPYAGRVQGINRSGYFGAYNAGKKSMALNMQKPRSRDIVRRLVEKCDVLIEAFVPGVMKRWGLAWDDVSAWNPRLIMASHCLQGQTGPRAGHRGYGHIASAMSGWYDLTGLAGAEAVGPYSAYTDFASWPFFLTSILVALELRERTGRGQHIDHAQLETSIHFLAPLLLDLQINGRLARRQGNHEEAFAPNNAYPCAGDDRWIALSVSSDGEWAALCDVLGHPDAAADPRFAGHAARKANETALDDLIATWTTDRNDFELATALQARGVAAGAVERAQDLFEDPQFAHRRTFRRLQHAEIGEHAVVANTFRIEGVEAGPFAAAPLLGEHTHAVCSDVLGMSEEEIASYAALGIFE